MTDFSLRPLRATDAPSFAKYANNKNVWKNLRDLFPHPYRLEDAQNFIAKMTSTENHSLVRCIEVGGEAVGALGVHPLDDVYKRSAEVGYWLGEPFWGRAIISRALPMICDEAFAKLPELVRLQAAVYAWNPASARVLEKAGFTREGTLAKSVFKDGTLLDSWLYAKLR